LRLEVGFGGGGGGRASASGGSFAQRVSAETLVAEKIGFAVVVATAGTATGIGFTGGRSFGNGEGGGIGVAENIGGNWIAICVNSGNLGRVERNGGRTCSFGFEGENGGDSGTLVP